MACEAWWRFGKRTYRVVKTASGSSNAISSLQKVKPVRALLGPVNFLQRLVQASRGSASAVRNMQRLVNVSKCLVAGVCSPTARRLVEALQTIRIPQRLVKSGRGFGNTLSVTQKPMKAVTGCTNVVNTHQKLVKQVWSLVGAVSLPKKLVEVLEAQFAPHKGLRSMSRDC